MQLIIRFLFRDMILFIKRIFIPTIILMSLTACAFGTREVSLSYPPQQNREIDGVNVTDSTGVSSPIAIKVHTFQNNRFKIDPVTSQKKTSTIIGNVRNGFYMKTADVITNQNLEEWICNAVKYELEKNGYNVIDATQNNYTGHFWDLRGAMLNVYADAYFNYEGKVKLHLILKQYGSNEVLIDKNYEGVYKEANFAATEKGYKDVLEKSLSNAIGLIISDFNNLPKKASRETMLNN